MKIHPVAEIFPLLQGEDLQALAEDIRLNGLCDPIVVQHNVLLDGRNRLAACEIAGVSPTFREYERDNAVAFIISSNLHRRHLETGQRAALGVELKPHLAAEAKRRQGARTDLEHSGNPAGMFGEARDQAGTDLEHPGNPAQKFGRARDQAAQIVRVSGRTIEDAAAVKAASPELFEEVRAGRMTVPAAKREVRAREEKVRLEEAQAKVTAARKHDLTSVCDLRVCSCADLFASGIKPDAVITDPPYAEQFLPVYSELAESCGRFGVPLVAVMVGQSYLPEVMERLCEHLRYRWTLAYLTPGGQAVQQWESKVNCSWKPVLLFGEATHWIGDVARSRPNDNDKRFHEWGQSESGMADLVERLTAPGQLICDPFLGGGTTAVVSLALGRRFVGCDVDPACVEQSRLRVEASHA